MTRCCVCVAVSVAFRNPWFPPTAPSDTCTQFVCQDARLTLAALRVAQHCAASRLRGGGAPRVMARQRTFVAAAAVLLLVARDIVEAQQYHYEILSGMDAPGEVCACIVAMMGPPWQLPVWGAGSHTHTENLMRTHTHQHSHACMRMLDMIAICGAACRRILRTSGRAGTFNRRKRSAICTQSASPSTHRDGSSIACRICKARGTTCTCAWTARRRGRPSGCRAILYAAALMRIGF